MPASPPRSALVILTPVFEDWEALALLLPHLDRAAAAIPAAVRVLAVDDGSTQPAPVDFGGLGLTHITAVDVLTLRRNVGHQRAIACGLCHVEAHIPGAAVVVMDADGEDDPADVPRLYQRTSSARDSAPSSPNACAAQRDRPSPPSIISSATPTSR